MGEIINGKWSRPASVPYPSIWCKFKGRKEIDGVIPKFWIQDIPEDHFETVINIMETNFLNEEPTCTYSKMTSDEQSITDFREMWRDIIKEKVGLVCYMENPDRNGKPIIAAMNCMHVVSKSTSKSLMEPKGIKAIKIIGSLEYVCSMKDVFSELQIDKFLNAMGLYVLPQFRGQNIGLELLKAREPLCKALGIEATVTAFTATASQILAGRAGFKDLSTISYAELERINPTMKYPGIEKHTKDMKHMYIVY